MEPLIDYLPQCVTRFIQDISIDHTFTSWRVYGEDNVTISLKFCGNSNSNEPDLNIITKDRPIRHQQYRTKPPSSIRRDQQRQCERQTAKDKPNISPIVENNRPSFTIGHVSTPPEYNMFNLEDSGIESTRNLLSSTVHHTPICDNQYQRVDGTKHNATMSDIGVTCEGFTMDTSSQTCKAPTSGTDVSQQTCNIDASARASQTNPVTHRKCQTINFNNCTRRMQTLPIPHVHASTQSEQIHCNSVDTMTMITEVADASSHTPVLGTRHSQTLLIETEDKFTIMEKVSVLSPANNTFIPPNCKSARIQTDSPLTYLGVTSKARGTPYSDVWVQSATDFLMDNAAVLATMKDSLAELELSCSNNDGVT